MSTEIPEPWATRMVERGYTDRRSGGQGPGMGALAEATGLHTSTISEAINGRRTPSPKTVNELVDKLGEDVAEWLGVKYFGPWTPPAAVTALTRRQRKALEELIVAMTEGGEHGGDTAATSRGADAPAPVVPMKRAARTTGRRGSNQE